jgi:predicted RNA-binding protein associated with RNAse of E/G family
MAGCGNWYVNFEHPTRRTPDGFDTFDLTVDLVVDPDLSRLTWKDEDEYAHVRRPGITSDTEHQAIDDARAQVLAMVQERSRPFADAEAWTS